MAECLPNVCEGLIPSTKKYRNKKQNYVNKTLTDLKINLRKYGSLMLLVSLLELNKIHFSFHHFGK